MKKRQGIVFRTFLFSALLVTLVISISFAVLYFIIPSHYLNIKTARLNKNADQLVASLKTADPAESASLILNFSFVNNSSVLSLSANDQLLVDFSSPFISMKSDLGKDYEIMIYPEQIPPEEMEFANPSGASVFYIRDDIVATTPYPESENTLYAQEATNVNETITITQFEGATNAAPTSYTNEMVALDRVVESENIHSLTILSTLQPIDEAKDVVLSLYPFLLPICLLIGFVLSYAYARKISKPILQISAATVSMKNLEPEILSGIRTSDELGQLSLNLDELYLKLWENINNLESETEKAQLLEQYKTQFMQSASHELKTPVSALSGILEGMIDGVGVYKNKEKYLKECKALTNKLAELIDEILRASKSDLVEESKIENFQLKLIIDSALESQKTLAENKGIVVRLDLDDQAVATDKAVFSSSVSNLISNAVRYCKEGGEVNIKLKADKLIIENQCEDISDTELLKFTEPFYTRSYSRNKAESGTGLGLYIVKRNLEKLEIPFEISKSFLGIVVTLDLAQHIN